MCVRRVWRKDLVFFRGIFENEFWLNIGILVGMRGLFIVGDCDI